MFGKPWYYLLYMSKSSFLSTSGRINHREYLKGLFVLNYSLILLVGVGWGFWLMVYEFLGSSVSPAAAKSFDALFALTAFFIFFYGNIRLVIKRLHDLDRSGWFSMILFVPIINVIFVGYLVLKQGVAENNERGISSIAQTPGP